MRGLIHRPRPSALAIALSVSLFCLFFVTAETASAQTELPGLGSPGLVVYDSDAVPHICTGSDRDTYFLQGYIHAQNRFFQMDVQRRFFSGTLAELVGSSILAQDVQLRTLGLRRAAEESWAGYRTRGLDDLIEMLEAYAAGVNLYLAQNPLPAEYGALELASAEPWTPVDSVVIGKGLAFGLAFDLIDIDLSIEAAAYQAAGAVAGFDGLALLLEDVNRAAPFDPAVSIPQATAAPSKRSAPALEAPSARAVELARQYREEISEIPILAKTLEQRGNLEGSNWWMVSGARSVSGHPILANDPHLSLDTPTIFYENHLIASAEEGCGLTEKGGEKEVFVPTAESWAVSKSSHANLDAYGPSAPGAPSLILGCNDQICWGLTTNPMDVTDVYQEVLTIDPATGLPVATTFEGQQEPIQIVPQTFLFNQTNDGVFGNLADAGIGPLDGGLTLIVPRRNNGPIVNVDASQIPVIGLSVQYSGARATFELEALRRVTLARDLDDFEEALQYFDVGSQNFAYADREGNIAYFTTAEMPIREDLQTLNFPDGGIPPFFIRDGTHGLQHEWLGVQNPQPKQALDYEILPFDEMPQVVNPAEGYVINANNDPVGTTLDNDPLNQVRPGGGLFYLSPGYADGLRAGRIERLMQNLLAQGPVTRADLEAMQANNQLLDAELVAPFVINAFTNAAAAGAPAELANLAADAGIAEAVNRLAAWDYSTPTGIVQGFDPGDDPDNLPAPSADEIADSVAATIWSVYRGQLTRSVVDGTLQNVGLGDFLPGSGQSYKAVAHLLMTFDTGQGFGASGLDFFAGPDGLGREQKRDLVLLQNLRAALDLLASGTFAQAFNNSTDQDDYRWGYLHRIVFDHPLGPPFSVPPASGFQDVGPNLLGVARSGGYGAVDASSHSARADGVNDFMFGSGPVRRFVGEMDPKGIDAVEILPGGQSGVLGSPDYSNQLGRWLTNHYHPVLLDRDAIVADAVSQDEFQPPCLAGPETLCLQHARFKVEADWSVPLLNDGPAKVVQGASNLSGNLYFFDPENWEILVKVLDGCDVNGHYWVFVAGATNLSWELTVEDTQSGEVWTASNPFGQRSPAIVDTQAFATCP